VNPREDALVLWAATLELPPRQRAVLVLRYREDLTEAAAAGAGLGDEVDDGDHDEKPADRYALKDIPEPNGAVVM
jgi:hypothetical protein